MMTCCGRYCGVVVVLLTSTSTINDDNNIKRTDHAK
jgi:hypothetical protein